MTDYDLVKDVLQLISAVNDLSERVTRIEALINAELPEPPAPEQVKPEPPKPRLSVKAK